MKALTVCQPYASMIARMAAGVVGEKRVENRRWATTHRGPLVIHAGLSRRWFSVPVVDELLPRGCLLCVVRLVDCVWYSRGDGADEAPLPTRYRWLRRDNHAQGPCCWVLEPIGALITAPRWRGQLHLFDVPDNVVLSGMNQTIARALAEELAGRATDGASPCRS